MNQKKLAPPYSPNESNDEMEKSDSEEREPEESLTDESDLTDISQINENKEVDKKGKIENDKLMQIKIEKKDPENKKDSEENMNEVFEDEIKDNKVIEEILEFIEKKENEYQKLKEEEEGKVENVGNKVSQESEASDENDDKDEKEETDKKENIQDIIGTETPETNLRDIDINNKNNVTVNDILTSKSQYKSCCKTTLKSSRIIQNKEEQFSQKNENSENEISDNDEYNANANKKWIKIIEMIRSKNYRNLFQMALSIPRKKRNQINSILLESNLNLDKLLKDEKDKTFMYIIYGLFSSQTEYDVMMINYCFRENVNIINIMRIFAIRTKSRLAEIQNLYNLRYSTTLKKQLNSAINDIDFVEELFSVDRYKFEESDDFLKDKAIEIFENISQISAKDLLWIFIGYTPSCFQRLCSIFYMKYSYPVTFYLTYCKFTSTIKNILRIFHDVLISPFYYQLETIISFSVVTDNIVFFTYTILSLNEKVLAKLISIYKSDYSLNFGDLIKKFYIDEIQTFFLHYINNCIIEYG